MYKQRSFHFLWIGQTLANSGDLFYIVGIISFLYKITGSATLMALVPFIITFSRFLGGIIAPGIMDRFYLKTVLVFSQLGKTALFFALTAYLMTLSEPDSLYFIYSLIGLIAFLDGWATPARNSMLPRLVKKEELVKANGFVSVVDQSVQLGGWPIGGILIATFNGTFLIMLTLILFIISTVMMALIQDRNGNQKERSVSSTNKWDSVKGGWVTIWRTPSLKTVALMDLIDAITDVVWIAAILYIYVEDVLHKSEAWWGYINSSFFGGLILGGLVSLKGESIMMQRLHIGVFGGTLLVGVFTLLFGLSTIPLVSLIISVMVGVATQIKMISQQTVIQLNTSDNLLPKVFSSRDAILTGAFGLSSLIFGYLAETFGVQAVFVVAATLLTISGIWAYTRKEYLKPVEHTKH